MKILSTKELANEEVVKSNSRGGEVREALT